MKYILFFCLLISSGSFAQTGIGTSTPDASAKLEVNATNKGFLPPRVTLTSGTDNTTIPSPATGLLVYNTGNNVGLAAGYYFWNGGTWATIATAGGSGSVAAEFGSQMLGANPISITSSTPVELLSFTLPSAGTWEIIPVIRTQGSTTIVGQYALYDASGTLISNSEILAGYGVLSTTGTAAYQVTTTGSATYKIKAWASNGAYNVYSNTDGRSFVTWKKISGNSPMTVINYGDVKTGFQAADHNGWIKLNGRAKSTLSATQQTQATALGIGTNLPNADNAFLVQNGRALGDVFGANTKTIAQANLPNVTLGGTTTSDGSHTHTINVNSNTVTLVSGGTVAAMAEGNSNWTAGNAQYNASVISTAGNHTHSLTTSSMNGNVTQTTLDITPKSLSINTFIYLGF